MPDLILASSSPRRKELLAKLQIPFTSVTSNENEDFQPTALPHEVVMELALRKAKSVSKNYPDAVIIGADTIVVLGSDILGKPDNRQHARQMLERLSGSTHSVFTGVAIVFGEKTHYFYEKTDVTFWKLSPNEIERYLDSGEPFDKAGAYGIQGLGSLFVQSIQGDYFSVVGLPISRLYRELNNVKLLK